MTQNGYKCPQGWDPAELLSYVEGDLSRVARREVEQHLHDCAACASEVELLRHAHDLLRRHPEVFHPDERELYELVSGDTAPNAATCAHVESCPQCQEEVAILRDMVFSTGEIPKHSAEMPKTLMRRLEWLYGSKRVVWGMSRFKALLSDLTRLPFRAPALALSTAAAMLVVAILTVPMWQTFKGARQLQEMEQAPDSSSVTGERGLSEAGKERALPDMSVSGQAIPPERREGRETTPYQREPKTKTGSATGLSLGHGAPAAQKESWTAGKPGYARPRHPGYGYGATHLGPQKRKQPEQETGRLDLEKEKREESVAQRRVAAPSARVEPPRERHELRAPVEIQIVDPAGNPIPWVRFEAPDQLKERYSFFEGAPREKDLSPTGRALTPQGLRAPDDRSVAARLIRVSIERTGDFYNLTATLSEISSAQVRKTENAVATSRQDVAEKIKALVASLLLD